MSNREAARAFCDKWNLEGNVPDSGPLVDELTALLNARDASHEGEVAALRAEVERLRRQRDDWKERVEEVTDIGAKRLRVLETQHRALSDHVASGAALAPPPPIVINDPDGYVATLTADLAALRARLAEVEARRDEEYAAFGQAARDLAALRAEVERLKGVAEHAIHSHGSTDALIETLEHERDEALATMERVADLGNEQANISAALRAENVALRAFVEEYADEPCTYGDDCPDFPRGTDPRHGRCQNCKARRALGTGEPATPSSSGQAGEGEGP
jgi:DNA repair exonuclease SbcCD ATPase subunit